MAYDVNHLLRVGDAKTIHDAVQGQVDDLKSATDAIENIQQITDYTYYPLAIGIIHARAWGNPRTGDNTAYITEKQYPGTTGIDYYFDDTKYKIIFCVYQDDGTFYALSPDQTGNTWVETSPYRFSLDSSLATGYFVSVEIRKKDNSNFSSGEAVKLIWTEEHSDYPLRIRASAAGAVMINDYAQSMNFNNTLLAIDADGFIYRSGTLPTTHQNYVWLRTDMRPICGIDIDTKFTGTGDKMRIAFEFCNGKKLVFQLGKAISTNYFGRDVFDENTVDYSQYYSKKNDVTFSVGVHPLKFRKIGHTVFIYIDNILAFTYTSDFVNDIKGVGVNFRGTGTMSAYGKYRIVYNACFAHMSLDDQRECLRDITNTSPAYTSIFESPYFAPLKALHDEYGCVFTLELFNANSLTDPTWSLESVTDRYKTEFQANSHWLKFGYHGPDSTTYPNTMPTADLIANMQSAYTQIARFAGYACIDRVPRMSFFSATKEQVLAMKSSGLISGLLTADDNREVNSGLDSVELPIMQNYDTYTDYVNGIAYYRTEPRLDGNSYSTDSLNALWDSSDNHQIFIIFGHSIDSATMQGRFSTVAEWLMKKGIPYEFPMNVPA